MYSNAQQPGDLLEVGCALSSEGNEMRSGALFLVLSLGACSGAAPNDRCRLTPERCQGGPGGLCASDLDCATELCCPEEACGGGMCTFACEEGAQCPSPLVCHEGFCFYGCASELDCADEMQCVEVKKPRKESAQICQYPTAQSD